MTLFFCAFSSSLPPSLLEEVADILMETFRNRLNQKTKKALMKIAMLVTVLTVNQEILN